jgi:hypothetical protein
MTRTDHARRTRKLGKPLGSGGTAANLKRFDSRQKLDLIMDAISSLELSETEAWNDLACLSKHTVVEDVQAVPEGIFNSGNDEFTAVATVYAALNDSDRNGNVSLVSSFPALVEGHFDRDGKAVIDRVGVDTSAFYE